MQIPRPVSHVFYAPRVLCAVCSPRWEEFATEVAVSEDTPEGRTVTRVTASDADSGEFGRVMYFLTEGATDKFSVDANTVSTH